MDSIKHHCNECESEFIIKYDKEICPDDPVYCPFCADYLIETEIDEEEE